MTAVVEAELEAPEAAPQAFSIVCLSPQGWHVDLPTNRQQIMLRAARRGHEVLFVETGNFIGRHLWSLVRSRARTRHSLASQLASAEEVAPGIRARKALNLLPWGHTYHSVNSFNAAATARVVRRLARRLPQPVVLWIYDPCASAMAGSCGEAFAVYDCVDDYAEQAGGDPRKRELVSASDREAATRSRLVFATATPLFERHRELNAQTHLVRNVGDYAHFVPAADRAFAAPEVAGLPGPVIGFAGNFLAQKVDLALLEALAVRRPDWTLLLIGPGRADTQAALDRLAALPNVRWLGAKPYAELPRYVAAFDVALIPYVANRYTESCFPLKTFEYLAAGKPVVASGLPELAGLEPHVKVVDGADAYVAAIEQALAGTLEDEVDRRELAAQNTWESRAGRLLDLISAELAG
jgi:glycosyltransferase involved in cell wall biosynthesis